MVVSLNSSNVVWGISANKIAAIILCSPIIRLYLINYARPLIYTTFMSFPTLLAIKTAYTWLRVGKADLVSNFCLAFFKLTIFLCSWLRIYTH